MNLNLYFTVQLVSSLDSDLLDAQRKIIAPSIAEKTSLCWVFALYNAEGIKSPWSTGTNIGHNPQKEGFENQQTLRQTEQNEIWTWSVISILIIRKRISLAHTLPFHWPFSNKGKPAIGQLRRSHPHGRFF